MKKILRLLALFSMILFFSCEEDDLLEDANIQMNEIFETDGNAVNVSVEQMQCNVKVRYASIVVSEYPEMYDPKVYGISMYHNKSTLISGLKDNKDYYYYFKLSNNVDNAQTGISSFRTKFIYKAEPKVNDKSAGEITCSTKEGFFDDFVRITAVANEGYYFVKWNDGVTSESRMVRVQDASGYEAIFSRKSVVLTLNVLATNTGLVKGAGTYFYGDKVNIAATPATGYEFVKWSDGNTNPNREVVLTSDKILIASFQKLKYIIILSASPSFGGEVTGNGTYEYGESVTIKATPASGYKFREWTDGSTSASRTFTVEESKNVTAIFTPNKYTLNISASPSTGGTVSGGGSYEYGEYATIKATPASGYEFDGWSDGYTSTSRSYYVTGNKTLTAYFKKKVTKYTLTLSASPSYGGSVSGGGSYEYGEYAKIQATPASEYEFDKWSDGSTLASRSYYVAGNKTLTAYFKKAKYILTVFASPYYGGTVTGGGSYEYGEYATIKATPASGYEFDGWSDGSTLASRSYYVTESKTLTANFKKTVTKYTLTLSASPSTGGTVTGGGSYEYGEYATIQATPVSGYEFDEWSDGYTSASRSYYVTGNKTLTAYFKKKVTKYTLTLSASPYYGGTVTGGGSYEYGEYATIKATPASGYEFDGWSDGYTSASRSYYVTGNKTLTAYFKKKVTKYTLTLSASPSYGGTVTGGGSYEYGEYATIKATPASGYEFDGWSDGYTSVSRSYYVTGNKTLTAYFKKKVTKYTLTLSASPSYGGTVSGGGSYEYGEYATIKATPASGYEFDGWSDGYTSVSRSYYVTGNKTLTAYFKKKVTKYTLTLSVSPSYGGTVSGGGTYEEDEYVYIKATPASGYTFSMWSDGNTSASRYVTIYSDKSLTAFFTYNSVTEYKLTLTASNGGTVSGGGWYEYGDQVYIKATPSSGYKFKEWSDGNTSASRYISIYGNKSLTAYFVRSY